MKRLFLLGFTLIIVFVFFIAGLFYSNLMKPVQESNEEVVFEVEPGPFFRTANRLVKDRLIPDRRSFVLYADITGKAKKLKTGEYLLNRNMTPIEILDELISGKSINYSFTIKEGFNLLDISKVLEEKQLIQSDTFLSLVRDPKFIREITGRNYVNLEGFLFPDTYRVSKSDSPETIIRAMYERFKEVYQDVTRARNSLDMPMYQHLTLASIIEKETGAAEERPLISSVFHNRLKKNMRLQTDPTILYGIWVETGIWKKNIRRKDITSKNSYNTYTFRGLPAGPIANPGEESLRAALNPSESSYLYFVSRNDGTHKFSKTFEEHNRAVRKFQLNPSARKGKSWRDRLKN